MLIWRTGGERMRIGGCHRVNGAGELTMYGNIEIVCCSHIAIAAVQHLVLERLLLVDSNP